MASFADVVKRQRKEGSSRTGALASAVGQKTLEAIDPRKFFDQSGVLTSLFPSLKAYKARGAGDKDVGDKSLNKLATLQASGDAATRVTLEEMVVKLDSNLVYSRMIAKNSTVLPQMARDANLTKQNIGRLLNLFGETQATKANDYFKREDEREAAVEGAQARRTAGRQNQPTKVETKKEDSFLSTLLAPLLSALAPLISSIKSFGSDLKALMGITQGMSALRIAIAALTSPVALLVAPLALLALWLRKQGGELPTSEDVAQGNVPGGWTPEQGARASPPAEPATDDELARVRKNLEPQTMDPDGSYAQAEKSRLTRQSPSPSPSSGTPSTSPSPVKETFDIEKYKEQVGFFEGRGKYNADNKIGFIGKYQFGSQALETFGYLKPGTSTDKMAVYNPENWTGKDGIKNADDFKSNAQLQDKLFNEYTLQNLRGLIKAKVIDLANMSGEEIASRLYAAHHGGVGGASKYFLQGKDTQDFAYANASVGKSAEKMKVSYAGGKAPTSGPSIAAASMASLDGKMALAMAPTNTPTIIQDNSTKVQNSGSGSTQQISAWDSFMLENIIKMKT